MIPFPIATFGRAASAPPLVAGSVTGATINVSGESGVSGYFPGASATGGTPPYTYEWFKPAGIGDARISFADKTSRQTRLTYSGYSFVGDVGGVSATFTVRDSAGQSDAAPGSANFNLQRTS